MASPVSGSAISRGGGIFNRRYGDFCTGADTSNGRQACYLAYAASNNALYLVDDAGYAEGPYGQHGIERRRIFNPEKPVQRGDVVGGLVREHAHPDAEYYIQGSLCREPHPVRSRA